MWTLRAGGYAKTDGGNGAPADIVLAFQGWKDVMKNNLGGQKNNVKMSGFIIPFEELREINFRVA